MAMKNKSKAGTSAGRRRALWWCVGAGALVLLVGIGVVLFAGGSGSPKLPPPPTQEELTELLEPDKLQAMAPKERVEHLRTVGRRVAVMPRENRRTVFDEGGVGQLLDKLPDEERGAFREAMFEMRREMHESGQTEEQGEDGERRRHGFERMREMVDEFFKASSKEQTAMLDERIDRMLEWRKRAEERSRSRPEREGPPRRRRERPQPTQDQMDEFSRRHLNASEPEDRAKMQEYFRRMQERAQQRGVEMGGPWGGRRR